MKTPLTPSSRAGFSMIDVLILVAVLLFLAALMLPSLARTKGRRPGISCVNQLKQVGLAYRIWAGDNNDLYPMQVSTEYGGSMELVQIGDVVSTYRAMSNELSTTKILVCPSETKRSYATNFFTLTATNVSYFVGLDANETNVMAFLSGDRNLTNGTRLHRGVLELTAATPAGWTREIHGDAGNIGMADGSVQQVSTPGLRDAIARTGWLTNRLAIP